MILFCSVCGRRLTRDEEYEGICDRCNHKERVITKTRTDRRRLKRGLRNVRK